MFKKVEDILQRQRSIDQVNNNDVHDSLLMINERVPPGIHFKNSNATRTNGPKRKEVPCKVNKRSKSWIEKRAKKNKDWKINSSSFSK